MNNLVLDLENLKQSFNKKEIVYYWMLLVKVYEISLQLEASKINNEEKKQMIKVFKDIIFNNNLDKIITIENLNNLFEPPAGNIDIESEDNFITLFNLILQQWDGSPDNIFSYKIKQITKEYIDQILIKENFSQITEEIVTNNNENDNDLFAEYPTFNNFFIKNKEYLREYVIRKKIIEYKCNCCGLTSWQNNPLMLHLHSTNGVYNNMNLDCLEFLCPNCYSQIGD